MTRIDRNLLTAQLEEALAEVGCPICHLMGIAERRHLDIVLYEQVNDLGTRRVLRKARGYCQFHTYQLLEIGGYGIHGKIAILYRDLVDDITAQVEAADARRPVSLRMGHGCPCCAEMRQCEETYASLLAGFVKEDARRAAYRQSSGLCLAHWERVYNLSDADSRGFLRLDQAKRLRALSADLAEFVRKTVVQSEPFGDERDVWIRALRTYAGSLRAPRIRPHLTDTQAKEASV